MELKPQDLLFLGIFILLLMKRDPKYFLIAGLISTALSVPLFYKWVFFTAQRFVYYGALFLFIAAILNFIKLRNNK